MKKTEIIDHVLKGSKILVAEFRSEEISDHPGKNPGDGPRGRRVVKVLFGDDSADVSEWARNGQKLIPLNRKKGDSVVIEFDTFERSKYGVRVLARSISPLE